MRLIIFTSLLFHVSISQEIPKEYFISDSILLSHNLGNNWSKKSLLDQLRYFHFNKNEKDSLRVNMNTDIGLNLSSNYYYFYLSNQVRFKENYYLNAKLRIANSGSNIPGYTGLARKKNRFGGFNSGEYEYASIGYQSEWFLFQFGRGREVWGAGKDISLILSGSSPSYDYLLLGLNLKNYRLRYFHGFLESIGHSNPINRYIVGRGIERTNFKNFLIAFNEIIIYQGENRGLDLAMLNPIGLHNEIELNNRQNVQGNNQNGVWQMSIDYFGFNRLRVSINYLIDELTFEDEGLAKEEDNLTGISSKVSYNVGSYKHFIALIDFTFEKVGTYTFKHKYGMNNFSSRNLLIGNTNGSDFIKKQISISVFDLSKVNFKASYYALKRGSNNIFLNPYSSNENIYKVAFPSGTVDYNYSFELDVKYWIYNNFYLNMNYITSDDYYKDKKIRLSLFYYIPIVQFINN